MTESASSERQAHIVNGDVTRKSCASYGTQRYLQWDAHTHARDISILFKMGALKMTDMKMMDQIAGHKNAGHEIERHDKYLFTVVSTNPSNLAVS